MTTSSDLRVCGNRQGSLLQFARFGGWILYLKRKTISANEISELLGSSSLHSPQHLKTSPLEDGGGGGWVGRVSY